MVSCRPKTMKTMLVTVRGKTTPSKQDGLDVNVAFADSTGCDVDSSPSASVTAARLVVRM